MKLMILIVVILCVLPINGKEKGRQINKNQVAAQDTVKAKVGNPIAPPDTKIVINEETADKQRDRIPDHPTSYLSRLLSAENLPPLGLFAVGAIGICVAVKTLKAIQRQAMVMIKQSRVLQQQAQIMSRQTKAVEDSVKLQKALARQRVDLQDWEAKVKSVSDEEIILLIFFDIVNPTNMPLTLRTIKVFGTFGQREAFTSVYILSPLAKRLIDFQITIRKESIPAYWSNQLVLHVFGTISFIDCFGDWREHLIGEVCRAGEQGFTFTPFDGWIPSEEESSDDPETEEDPAKK